MLNGHYNKALN